MTNQKTGPVNRKTLCVGENLLENKDNSEEKEKSKETLRAQFKHPDPGRSETNNLSTF